jgi:hypothetical protein
MNTLKDDKDMGMLNQLICNANRFNNNVEQALEIAHRLNKQDLIRYLNRLKAILNGAK